MKQKLIDPGKVYQEQMKHCGHSSVMIHPELLVYLKSSELLFWIEICRRANMTKFPDGTFIAEIGDMARSVCMKERHAKDMLSSLVEIGFVKRYRKKGYRYEISYSSITTLLNVLDLNPGCGRELRNIREQQNIDFIKNSEIRNACKAAGVEFTECDFLVK